MNRKIRNASWSNDGFTLMEMLIVIAIIGVLVAIAIPVFASQVDNAKRGADQANARSAEAVAVSQYYADGIPETSTYFYDAGSGTVSKSMSGIEGYGQSQVEVEGSIGIPNPGGNNPKVVSITFANGGDTRMVTWGGSASRKILSAQDIDAATEAERVAQDTTLLNALQDVFQGMTAGDLKQLLGESSNLRSKDFVIGITKARAVGQQSSANKYTLEHQEIKPGFEDILASIGVDVDKVKNLQETLITTAGSGNDVRIKIYVGRNTDLININDDTVLTNAYIYLDAQDAQDKKFSSLYTAERAKTV